MKLRAGRVGKFGVPYMGNKQKLMPIISSFFPNAENFYDLFGGGFSVTHYMMINRLNSYKSFYYNEIQSGNVKLVQDAINGKYNYDNFKPEWIDRERFFKERDEDFYIKYLWSFGNSGTSYLFGKEIENEKRSMHQAVVFNEFDDFVKGTLGISSWPNDLTITGKRLYLKRIVNSMSTRLAHLGRLEHLEQLQRLEQLEKIDNKLILTSLDYRQVNIKPNSVIYCDIPYKDTAGYGNEFDHEDFFDWVREQVNPVFISEYKIDSKNIFLLKEINHRTTLSASVKDLHRVERLYGNYAAYEIIRPFLREQSDNRVKKQKGP